jgi:DNA-damage-inducible protein J
MLHVRVDDELKTRASEVLAEVGLTLSDAVRILLTQVANDGGLPPGLVVDTEAHDAWFRAKVLEALGDRRPAASHEEVMTEMRALLEQRRRA